MVLALKPTFITVQSSKAPPLLFSVILHGLYNLYRNFSTLAGSTISKNAPFSYKKRTKCKKNIGNAEPKIKWTEEQKNIVTDVRGGFSVFITGSAGTGKTVLLKHIINILKRAHGSSRVAVTASTGIAACAIKGQTLHSFAGFGNGNGDIGTLLDRIGRNERAFKRWKKVKVLVIDEISMIDANMFEKLECIARNIRGSKEIWGGIQLIVSGDFFQLPPVLDKHNSSGKVFAFEADCWGASFDSQVEITEVFRQTDAELIRLLQKMRKGVIDLEDLKLLEQCCSSEEPDVSVARLYPRIEDVNRINEERIKSLGEKLVVYRAADGGPDISNFSKVIEQGMASERLELCIGARVILNKNLKVWCKLCNGATGTVTGFFRSHEDVKDLSPDNLLPIVKFDSGVEEVIKPQKWEYFFDNKLVAWRYQLPLRLAWALSIHKSQGMTIDRLHTDLSRIFCCGMAYVVLSRVKTLKGLHLSGFSPSMIRAEPKVIHFYKQLAVEQGKEDEDVNYKE
ncbi:ATP-dependent DNA helicase PIF1-like [Mercurialis annua]|uniref:ATP-dependent DNA helicase PIF1-like n=1 Tax=Mercurialis annua TaxID=3986 RepID=UPI00215EDD2B|nr:ATP-dependent DNA helicase PIF1-like [Mercurialis annua]